ncbi:MAG: hypothetical protein WC599_06620 [Bacteroidales bacterium]
MDLYSPKSQKPVSFKKNTIKSDVITNKKGKVHGSEIVFELKEKGGGEDKETLIVSFFDFLKVKFYERMKVFFDYEDKYKEKPATDIKGSTKNY